MCPTIVNNVETLCNVKHIVAMGGAEFAKLGTPNNTGTRIVSVSGHVKKPGYYEIEVGKVTIGAAHQRSEFWRRLARRTQIEGRHSRRFVRESFQGRREIQAQEQRTPMARTSSRRSTCSICLTISIRSSPPGRMSGSSAIIVMDDSTDIVEALANISEFYAHESCGQCTPCREGSLWMSKALHRLTHGEGRASGCGLSGEDRRQHSRRPHDLRVRRSLLVAGAKFCREVQR